MKFVDAKKLRDEDEVIVKKTSCVLHVLGDVEVDGKDVFIPCDDGKLYCRQISQSGPAQMYYLRGTWFKMRTCPGLTGAKRYSTITQTEGREPYAEWTYHEWGHTRRQIFW